MGNGEIRQIVSGLVPYYKPEELVDKKIVLIYNLKSSVLREVKSEGMLLAAETKNKKNVEVISPDCKVGDIITIDDATPNNDEITIDEFFSVPMDVKDFSIMFMEKPLKANNKIIRVKKVKDGKVG